nr:extensin isoform X1 [Ipomoea batatas]
MEAFPLRFNAEGDVIVPYEAFLLVSLQIKEHLGYNFIGLIFGLVSDTHKRLEKRLVTVSVLVLNPYCHMFVRGCDVDGIAVGNDVAATGIEYDSCGGMDS